jgi:hypothetical protein
MFQRRARLLIVCGLAGLTSHVNAAKPISDTLARKLAPAVAKILLQRASTTALLHDCGQHYPRLAPATERAMAHWLSANQTILRKADTLRDQLWQSLKQEQSRFTAEKYALDIDKLIQQNVQHVEHTLAAYPPQQQRALCNHLILAVNAGDWDIQHKQANAFTILQNYP